MSNLNISNFIRCAYCKLGFNFAEQLLASEINIKENHN